MQKSPGRSHLVQRQKARKLVKQYQIPFVLALRVATREISLVDALRENERERALGHLQENFELSKGESILVHKGEIELEDLLEKKRRKKHLEENVGESVFSQARSEDSELLLWVHGNRVVTGKIDVLEQYDFTLSNGEKFSKLEIKAAAFSDFHHTILQARSQQCEPIVRIEKRFRVSNKQLFTFHESKANLTVELLEGLVFTGMLKAISRFELELVNQDNDSLHIFRHALYSITAE